MAVTVEIAGIVRTTKVGKNISWTDTVNSLKQARFIVADDADGFVPASGQAVEIKQDGTIRFDGQITGRPRRLAGPAHPSQLTFYDVTVGGYEVLLNKKTVTRAYEDVAFETIVADLDSTYLSADGITLNVTAGTNHTITFNNVTVAAAIERLCELEADGRTWRMDVGKILTIETLTTTAAPVVLDPDLDTLGLDPKPTVEPDMSTYANTVIVTGGGPDLQITQKVLDAAEITARISVEGGGDGIYEHTEERNDLKTEGEVLAAAQGVLEKRKIVRDRFTGITRVAGFAAGQSVTVNISSMDISSQVFFIESVRTVTDPAGTEFRHHINGITGDPDGGWQSYYRNEKKQVRTIAMQIEATPGLVRIESRAGALVHAPPTVPAEWFQGDVSGAVTAGFGGFAVTPDGRSMLIVGRGGAANTGGCGGGQFPGCTAACFDNRQTVFRRFAIDPTTRKPDATSANCGSWDELLASDSFKTMMSVRPDSRKAALIQFAAPGKFILVDVNTAVIDGSVDTNIDANAFGGEPIWVGDFVFWPEPSSADIYVYDVSDVNNPTEHAVFATSLTGVDAIIASADGSVLWAVGNGGFVGLDNSTAGTLAEDTFLTAGISGSYNSLAIKQSDESIIVAMIRADASNVRVLTLDVVGSGITKNTEKLVALATSLMDGFGVMFWDDSAICFSAKDVSGANTLKAHVFDITDPTDPTFVETFSYVHDANNNRGPFKTDATHQALYLFGGLADAQITYGVDQFDRVVPYSIDEELREDYGGTGQGGPLNRYVPGDILSAIGPTDLARIPVGKNDEIPVADSSEDAGWKWEQWMLRDLVNGTFRETFNALVTSDGAVVTLTIQQDPTGDLTMLFSDGSSNLDCTPALTTTLTAGSDASPTENFVYVLKSDKALTVSTSNWPTTEHIKVGFFLVPSAGFVQTEGVYINQNWNDHLKGTDEQGHLTHMAERSRLLGAIYHSGIAGNGTTEYVTITGAGPSTVFFKSTAGVLYQMHQHAYPAKDTDPGGAGDMVLVVNDSVTAFDDISDLADLLTDAAGGSMSGKYFNLVVWGVANKGGEFGPMMVNLPGGSYSKQSDAEQDVDGHDVFVIPAAFANESSTGFLICRITLRHQAAAGGTWTHISTLDLRGVSPAAAAGGSTGVTTTEFADNTFVIFDEADVTREIEFDAGSITPGNKRKLTAPDGDGTLILGTGLSGGQTVIGGLDAGDPLTLVSTGHGTKGPIFFGAAQTSQYDEVNDIFFIGDDACADLTTGIVVNQGGAADAVFVGKKSQVAHGITDEAETDTWGFISAANAIQGGFRLSGFSEANRAVEITAIITSGDTTFSNSGAAAVEIECSIKSGAGIVDLTNENLLAIKKGPSGTNDTMHIFNAAGDLWIQGSFFVQAVSNVNMTSGVTIDQGTNDNQAYCFRSTDVATVLTTAPAANVATSDWYTVQKKTGAEGGVLIQALCEDGGAAETSYEVRAYGATADTTKSTAGTALMYFYASEHDGANALTNVPVGGNVWGVGCRRGGADVSVLLVDQAGKMWLEGELELDGDLNHDGSNIGLFGTAPVAQQTVAGARDNPEAALANLLTALANYGTIIDNTTAS